MTCLMSRICAQADGCNIHDRYTLEKCSAFKEQQTNFSSITSSPEALAEFIIDKLQYCKRPVCPICPVWKKCDGVSKDAFVKWLKQESDTEC